MLILLSALIASRAARCTHSYQIDDCAEDRCEEINGHEICMECRFDGHVPIDGKCIKYDSDEHSSCHNADGTIITTQRRCGMCTDSMHLYKGGCYNVTVDTIGMTYLGLDTKPSHVELRKTPMSGFQNARDTYVRCQDPHCKICSHDINTCEVCIDGYYNSDKCKQCDSSCETCVGGDPTQCLTCPSNTYLQFLMGGFGMCVDASQCGYGMYADSSSQTCTRCSAECSTCNGPGEDQCTSCSSKTHFFDDSGSGTGRCVECGDTTNPKGIADCRECNSEGGSVVCLVCNPGHTLIDGKCQLPCRNPTDCAEGSCVVGIGENLYCRLCKTSGYAPVDGICTDITGANPSGCVPGANPNSARRCFQCGAGYFLHKGGCYAIGGDPGNFICADEASGSGGTEGVCSTCKTANGFFKHPSPDATKQSCISCSETSNVDGVKGVVDCTTCKPPASAGTSTPTTAVCTKCDTTKYLKKADDGTTTCISADECTVDQNKFFKVEDPIKKCVSCGDAQDAVDGCDTCTYDSGTKKATCTKCTSNYLKTVDGATTCVADCGEGYFGQTDNTQKKTCQSCATASGLTPSVTGIEGCTSCTYTSSTLKCTACGEGKKPNKEGIACFDCSISGCAYCSGAGKCEECASGFKLEDEACVSAGANRSGLSTGVIAGISVAVVIVVGGLVSFLCRWFVRHKRM